jgi:hypothetical protein
MVNFILCNICLRIRIEVLRSQGYGTTRGLISKAVI